MQLHRSKHVKSSKMSFSSDHFNRLIATRLKCVRLGSGSAANAESTQNDVVTASKGVFEGDPRCGTVVVPAAAGF